MLSVWAFAGEPEVACSDIVTVPVICPEPIATRLKAAESKDRPKRVFGEHVVGAVELRGWRWVAATVYADPEGKGLFPWEIAACGGFTRQS